MASFFTDNDDLRFYFDHGVDWSSLVEISEYGYRTKDGFKSAPEALQFYRQVAEMAALAIDLEDYMGWPVDIECAYSRGKLYLLQCRPITTLQ